MMRYLRLNYALCGMVVLFLLALLGCQSGTETAVSPNDETTLSEVLTTVPTDTPAPTHTAVLPTATAEPTATAVSAKTPVPTDTPEPAVDMLGLMTPLDQIRDAETALIESKTATIFISSTIASPDGALASTETCMLQFLNKAYCLSETTITTPGEEDLTLPGEALILDGQFWDRVGDNDWEESAMLELLGIAEGDTGLERYFLAPYVIDAKVGKPTDLDGVKTMRVDFTLDTRRYVEEAIGLGIAFFLGPNGMEAQTSGSLWIDVEDNLPYFSELTMTTSDNPPTQMVVHTTYIDIGAPVEIPDAPN